MIEFSRLENNMTQEQMKAQKDKELKEACAAFEGMFMDMMMKTMRKATMESSLIKKSNGEKIFTEMLDQQYVDILAKRGDSGLGNMLYEHLKSTMPEYQDRGKNFHRELNPYEIQQKRRESVSSETLNLVQ